MMHHTTMQGEPKILSECTLPLTARACVDMTMTDVAVLEPANGTVVVREHAPGWSPEEIQAITGAPLLLAEDLREFTLL